MKCFFKSNLQKTHSQDIDDLYVASNYADNGDGRTNCLFNKFISNYILAETEFCISENLYRSKFLPFPLESVSESSSETDGESDIPEKASRLSADACARSDDVYV